MCRISTPARDDWCWSEHQQQQHPRVVFGNWIQFCFNYFWIVISEDEPGNVFTIGNVCSFPKQRKYVRIWCEVIRTEHFCFKTYLDRSCCGLAEWKAVMLDWRLQQPHFITQLWQQQAAGGNWGGRVGSPLTVWQCGEEDGRDAAMTIYNIWKNGAKLRIFNRRVLILLPDNLCWLLPAWPGPASRHTGSRGA